MPSQLTKKSATGRPTPAPSLRPRPDEATHDADLVRLGFLALLHLPLGLLITRHFAFATLHAAVVLGWLALAAWDVRRPDRVAFAAAYVVGSDVLWRMSDAMVFHQMAKYALVGAFLLWVMRAGRPRGTLGPVALGLLLLPSIWAAEEATNLAYLKGAVSFNLSGPFSLAASLLFFQQVVVRRVDLARLLVHLVAPILAILAISFDSTVRAEDLIFSNESNFVTSGGYGPNQVSSVLSLGAMCLLLLPLLTTIGRLGGLLVTAGVLCLGTQSALTFSRGGLYGAVGALLLALPFLLVRKRLRGPILVVSAGLVLCGMLLVVPHLETFTEGQFTRRLADTDMAGRDELMTRDLTVWAEHPLLGVGPGMSQLSKLEDTRTGVAHTEYTRLLAEHGMLGVVALLLLATLGFLLVASAPPGIPRGVTVCFLAWAGLYMFHAAMRLAAPGFLFGLAAGAASLAPDSEEGPAPEASR